MTGDPSSLRGAGALIPGGAGALTRSSFLLPALVPLVFGIVILALAPLHHFLTFTVEIDFPRYASQARSLAEVLTWHPYVPLGYPLGLWFLSRLGFSVFGAGQFLAGLSAVALLVLVYLLARRFLSVSDSVIAQALLALNWHFAQYGILCNSDLPWVLVQLASFVFLFRAFEKPLLRKALEAGLLLGFAFDLRYQTLVALPLMILFLFGVWLQTTRFTRASLGALALAFGFAVAAGPQLAINLSQKHSLLATNLAENVWMGIYGEGNFVEHWPEAQEHPDLLEIIKQDPRRFLRHWAKESAICLLRLPLLALGLQPVLVTLEPEATLRLILLILLASCGFGFGAGLALGSWRSRRWRRPSAASLFLASYVVIYAATVSLAYTSFRYLLPLAPLTVLLAVKILSLLKPRRGFRQLLAPASLAVAMAGLSIWGFYVTLERFQCRVKEVDAAILGQNPAGEIRVISNLAGLYGFHLPYQWIPLPPEIQTPEQLQQFAVLKDIHYLLFEEAHLRSRAPENWPELKNWAFAQPGLYRRTGYPALILLPLAER